MEIIFSLACTAGARSLCLLNFPLRQPPAPSSAGSLGPPSSQGLDLNLPHVPHVGPIWGTQGATTSFAAPCIRAGLEGFVINN